MKVLLLCDRGSGQLREPLRNALSAAGHEVNLINLNREEIKPCIGCFGCWLKTPGICVQTRDEANAVARQEIQAGAVILLSEITFGGYSADIKAFLDRSIQNILPYFEIIDDEMHHEMRYERFPVWIAIGYGNVSPEEKLSFLELAERNAINMRPQKHLAIALDGADTLPGAERTILQELEGLA